MSGFAAGRYRLRIRSFRLSAGISARDLHLSAALIDNVADTFDRTRELTTAFARGHGLDLADDLAIVRNLATALDLALDRDLGAALDRVRELTAALGIASAHAWNLELDLHWDRADDLDIALDAARNIGYACDDACGLARDLVEVLERAGVTAGMAGVRSHGQQRVTAAAARLLAVAARLLPAADRARYAAEFRAELWDLAQAGAPRRAQLVYAARQVQSAVRLRSALLAPARRGATP